MFSNSQILDLTFQNLNILNPKCTKRQKWYTQSLFRTEKYKILTPLPLWEKNKLITWKNPFLFMKISNIMTKSSEALVSFWKYKLPSFMQSKWSVWFSVKLESVLWVRLLHVNQTKDSLSNWNKFTKVLKRLKILFLIKSLNS